MLLLGIDIGSSSVKVQVMDGETGKSVAATHFPKEELRIIAVEKGWAEQAPELWWECVKQGCRELITKYKVDVNAIAAIGISYQMHGLVLVDKNQQVLRPAIIWCDSRAVALGKQAFEEIGPDLCLAHMLNSPGNFTASKLKWVQENEPALYAKIYKIMLPGDYIAMKLTGEIYTTASGLSEGILWDFAKEEPAQLLLNHYQFDAKLLPTLIPTFGNQGALTQQAAQELGLKVGTKITYRAGDQPNNAFSLNVLQPGEIAATAGTSGVIYAVTDQQSKDEAGRVNTFLHVNHTAAEKRNGVLLCVNGTGILYSWLRKMLNIAAEKASYQQLNRLAAAAPIGSEGLLFYPFGNGAERLLGNQEPNASLHQLNFNIHHHAHMVRAAQEGIAFALNYGFEVLQEIGVGGTRVKAGKANLFLSPVFREAFVNTTQTTLELYHTDGAEGAARGAGVGLAYYKNYQEAFIGLDCLAQLEPDPSKSRLYLAAYEAWKAALPIDQE
ncbi:MAG: xylulokinase [Flammeovirgaceae bacterium]